MGLTRYSFLLVSVLIFAFISAGFSQTKDENGSKQWFTLGEKIRDKNSALSAKFLEGDYATMAQIFGENAILVTPKGEIIQGKDGISKFWSELKKKEVKDVTFKTMNVFITEVKEENPDKRDYVAYEIGEYSYTDQGKVTGGSYVHVRWHIKWCKWFP